MRSYEFRITVEAATASMAAERRSNADLADIERTLARAANELDHGVYHLLADLNFEFHRAVARATHNPFYLKTVEMIPNFVGVDRLDLTAFGGEDLPERTQRIHAEHVAIFEAIRRQEPEQALAEMQRHIAAARDFVLERQAFTAPARPARAPNCPETSARNRKFDQPGVRARMARRARPREEEAQVNTRRDVLKLLSGTTAGGCGGPVAR